MFLKVSNINFYYSEKRILNDISFSLEKGKIIGVVGASGSGKSTLLRLLSSILKLGDNRNTGDIEIKDLTPEEYRKTGKLAFMFQEAALMPNLNVRKNIEFPLKLLKRKIITKEIDELIELVGLSEYQKFLPSTLSGGMKTRVALVRAFVTSPELLLLDEPFSSLDVSWKFNLYGYLEEIRRRYNTTIVMVTHDIQEAILLADKIFVLAKNGTKIKERKIVRDKQLTFEYDDVNKYLAKMQDVFLELQSDIIIDGNKIFSTIHEAIAYTTKLKEDILNNKDYSNFNRLELMAIKYFVNDENVKNNIRFLWRNSNSILLKYELVWRFSELEDLTLQDYNNIYDFYIDNWEDVIKISTNQEYHGKIDVVFENVMMALQSNDYSNSSKWIYLPYITGMLLNTQYENKIEKFLKRIYENKSEFSKLPFFKIRAKQLIERFFVNESNI